MLGGCRQNVGEPGELVGVQVAVVVAGDAGVERDDPQAVHLVDPVLEAVVLGVEETAREGGALVVVAHRPDHDGAHLGGGRLDDRAQRRVGLRLGGGRRGRR